MQPILALIVPVDSSGAPSHPIAPGGQPPGIWPSPGYPSHPIAPGGPPAGVAPPVFPTPPIYIPIEPPAGPDGEPSHPIYIPVIPSHPIAPGGGGGVGIWPAPGVPTNPIAPGGPPPQVANPIMPGGSVTHPIYGGFVLVWSPAYGWIFVPAGGPPTGGAPGSAPQPDQELPEVEE
jgi:hypothetical protein